MNPKWNGDSASEVGVDVLWYVAVNNGAWDSAIFTDLSLGQC